LIGIAVVFIPFVGSELVIISSSTADNMSGTGPIVIGGQIGPFRHGTLVTKDLRSATPVDEDVLTHPGADLIAPCGAGIYAIADGWVEDVIDSRNDRDFKALGFMVIVRHVTSLRARPTYSLYLHLQDAPFVKKGDAVKGSGPLYGTRLGSVGKTGITSGVCHIHFEIRHFASRYLDDSRWRRPANIYGQGNQNGAAVFTDNWEDPARFLGEDWEFLDNRVSPDGSTVISVKMVGGATNWITAMGARIISLVSGRETVIPFPGFPARMRQKLGAEDWTWHRDHQFRWSPGGRFVAFSRCSGDNEKPACLLFLLNATRTAPEVLAEDLALSQASRPRFQPVGFVGGRLLFTTSPDLYAYELTTRRSVLIQRGVWSAATSSDRRYVAYVTVGQNGNSSVWVSDVEGGNKRQLSSFAEVSRVEIRQVDVIGWLPNDEGIVFRNDNSSNQPETWTIRRDGSELKRIGW
jgi:hypothetical protein